MDKRISVTKMGTRSRAVSVTENMTIMDAIRESEILYEGDEQILLNGALTPDFEKIILEDNDVVEIRSTWMKGQNEQSY